MGVIKDGIKGVVGSIFRATKNTGFSERAIRKAEKIEKGQKVVPPKYPTTEKAFQEAQQNQSIREELSHKHEKLIDNASKITIKSEDPSPRKDVHRLSGDQPYENEEPQRWMYGFYEPPLEKMETGKLTFREALEVLRARLEVSGEGIAPSGAGGPKMEEAKKFLEAHPAVQRVEKEKLDTMFKYFRPFVRQEEQVVVRKDDVEELLDVIEDRRDEYESFRIELAEGTATINFRDGGEKLDAMVRKPEQQTETDQDEKLFGIAVSELRSKQQEEFKRLHQRLYDLRQLEEETQAEKSNAKEKDPGAKEKEEEHKSDKTAGRTSPG
ncbi:hypothetical protein DdX_10839 [Ditylenchus destructor]|uniref:Uncharacterized protein n=1 Tax=Ditylenchus destructor TaxID=166010 RepID=A0AAD4N3C1_9BILA|nr:hypothetical protein DdX_10839 [Ditylenchus destructor]